MGLSVSTRLTSGAEKNLNTGLGEPHRPKIGLKCKSRKLRQAVQPYHRLRSLNLKNSSIFPNQTAHDQTAHEQSGMRRLITACAARIYLEI